MASAASDIESCCIVGFDNEKLDTLFPEDIYNFCLAIEEGYSPSVTHLEAWLSKNIKTLKPEHPETLLALVGGLTKNAGSEFSASLDIGGLRPCFSHILNPANGGVFTQSWMLRMLVQITRPFKNYPLSYPALVQSVFLKTKGITLRNLFTVNLAAINQKSLLNEHTEALAGLTVGQLRDTDLTPLLEVGYTITEDSLQRVDGLLRQLYRQNAGYQKREPRMRNMLNFLYDEGLDVVGAHSQEFNERQQQIIRYLFSKRYLGTKELTLDFKCDRKTIQRDFSKLLSTEVVRSIGNGSALKYCINLKTNSYDMLEIYSVPVRKREEYQESLFGEEIWETKKA